MLGSVQVPHPVKFVDPTAKGNLNVIINHMWDQMFTVEGHWYRIFLEYGWLCKQLHCKTGTGLIKHWCNIATHGVAEIVEYVRDNKYDYFIWIMKRKTKEYDNNDEVSTLL